MPDTPQHSRTIRCTPENAAEFQRLVKNDPALHQMVQHLQAQGLFPGLRGMFITITGGPERLAQGLGAWQAIRAPQIAAEAEKQPATAQKGSAA